MAVPEVHDLKERIEADVIEIRAGFRAAAAAAGAAARELLAWVRVCDRARLWQRDGARSMAEWLSAEHHISNWKARRVIGAAHSLEQLPLVAAALESGALSLDRS